MLDTMLDNSRAWRQQCQSHEFDSQGMDEQIKCLNIECNASQFE